MNADLMAAARRVINEARLVAEASASQPGQIGRRHPTGSEPPGAWTASTSTLQSIGGRINDAIAAGDDVELATAVEWARTQLDLLKRGVPGRREETIAERRRRIARTYEGVPAPTVARQERMSVSLVRSDRQAAGRDPGTGEQIPARLRQFG